MNLGQLGQPLLQGAQKGGDCIYLRAAEVNPLHVCRRCLPVSDGVHLPWVIVQSLVSYQSTWLFSYPLSLVSCLIFWLLAEYGCPAAWQDSGGRAVGFNPNC